MKKENAVQKVEQEIYNLKVKLAELRKKQKPTLVKDYDFKGSQGEKVSLLELFGDKEELILVHNMGTGCTYCTTWADGFNGIYHHLENRAAFVVESPDSHQVQRKFAVDRRWGFKMVSSQGTRFRKDMGYEEDNSPTPGVSTFVKKGGKIYRFADTGFGPGDNFCIVWDILDLLPSPKKDWHPKFTYFSSKQNPKWAP